MTSIDFPFEKKHSTLFGEVYRPVAIVDFWSSKITAWVKVVAIVDTGADYTLLPNFYARDLGIELNKCKKHATAGIGGSEGVYLVKEVKVKLGDWEGRIPVGFLDRDNIPPLLGRKNFLEIFKLTLHKHRTHFSI